MQYHPWKEDDDDDKLNDLNLIAMYCTFYVILTYN